MEWVKVYSANDPVKAELINAVMHKNDIQTQVLDKVDSAYVMLGEIEIFVPAELADKARQIIEEDESID